MPAISQVQTADASTATTRLDQIRVRHRRSAVRPCGPARSSAGGITATRASAAPNTENDPATDSPRASARGSPPAIAKGGSVMATGYGLPDYGLIVKV